jgi:FKBP-type peptidyl-prolyl cis-trans isomerase 2
MRTTIIFIGAVIAAILAVAAAGCISPSAGPAGTQGGNITSTQQGPGSGATLFPTVPLAGTGSGMMAMPGDNVSVYYAGTFENGTPFDSNLESPAPLVFTLGNSTIIPGFEEAVTGMTVNQEKTVTIPAAKAYGDYNASLVRTVNRTGPIANTSFTVGEIFSIHDRTTNAYSAVRILKVTPTTVTWDANSPLSGLNFTFRIKLAGITRP